MSSVFENEFRAFGTPETGNPEELTMIARRQMRMKYCRADIGISGADQTAFGAFALLVNHPKIFVMVAKIARILQPLHRIVAGAKIDPLLAWTRSPVAPVIAKTSFRQYWKSRQR